jgi:hypothetical protein
VVTYDADVADPSARSAMVRPTTSDLIGKALVKWVSDAIGPQGGEIAILSAAATAENQNAWIAVIKQDLANYPQLKLVDTVYGDDDAAKSAEKASGLLQSHPNLKGIISPTTVGIAATAQYLSGSQYKGKVALTGLGLPSQMKAYTKDGTVKTFGLWDPAMLGYLGVYAAANVASKIDISWRVRGGRQEVHPGREEAGHGRTTAGVHRREHRQLQLLTELVCRCPEGRLRQAQRQQESFRALSEYRSRYQIMENRTDARPRHDQGRAAGAAHRAAVLGIRQLWYAIQGLRAGRGAPNAAGEGSPTPPRCTRSPARPRRWLCTSRGTGSTTTPVLPAMPPTSVWRSARSTRMCFKTTTTCSAA